MKTTSILSFLLLLFSTAAFSQTYLLNATTNGTTISTCTGAFYDSGGAAGVYGNNQNFTVTFCPSIAGNSVNLDFVPGAFQLAAGDQICFYDGTTVGAPLIGCATNAMPILAVQATAGNPSGCITVSFTSNATGTAGGWQAAVYCSSPCQTILSELGASFPAVDPVTGTIDICPGDQVNFLGQGNYIQNNTIYAQSDATSTFQWTVDGQVFTGQSLSYNFNNSGGYRVQLKITDVNGCESSNLLDQDVRVSGVPHFTGTTLPAATVCAGDTLQLIQGNVTQSTENFATPISRGDSIFLPDGNGTSYQTSITVADFAPGQILTNAADLGSICLVMEHSYMGDLNITITCPSGQTVTLHQYPGGSGTYLGIPVDNDATPLIPGQGIEYCWSSPAPNPTWAASAGGGTLPAGTYTPSSPLSGLVGCTLNGDWTITVTDNLLSDNGFIFNWGVNFSPALYPALDPFTPVTDSAIWIDNGTITNYISNSLITAVPNLVGNTNYTFFTINDFGCQFDTTLSVEVLPFTNPNCINCDFIYAVQPLADTSVCAGQSVVLDATVQSFVDESQFTYISGEPIETGTPINANLNVSDIFPNTITNTSIISVCLDVFHQIPSDLTFFLRAPSGQFVELSTNNGGFSPTGNVYQNTCFSPTAAQQINFATPPFAGTYRPEGSFNALLGATINGVWRLEVADVANGSIDGILNSWSITFDQTHNITYSWFPTTGLSCSNCATPTSTPTTTTTYIVNINDNFNCQKSDTVTVSVLQNLAAPAPTCGNTTSNSIVITWAAVTGATNYEVNINNTGWIPANGTLSHTLSGLSPSQTVSIDVRAVQTTPCTFTSAATNVICTTLPCAQTVALDSVQNVSCFGGNNGAVYVSTANSQLPVNYTLGGNTQNNGTFANLAAGIYSVIIVDNTACADTVVATITQPDSISLAANIVQNICFGENGGSLTVTPSGGTLPYSFAWQGSGVTSNSLNNLSVGTYTVTVTDANGCTKVANYNITQPTDISLNTVTSNATCFNLNNGSATVTATGGTGAYNYAWNTTPLQNTNTASNLLAGTYNVTVTDANGCADSATVTISEPTELVVSTSGSDAICFDAASGSVTATATGGTGAYTYLWNTTPPQNTVTAGSLTAGTYTVTVTDANNCTATSTTTIGQPTEIQLSLSSTPLTCFGLSDGSASVVATGGSGTYTYAWNTTPMQTQPTIGNLIEGTYEVTVTDGVGCSVSDTVYVWSYVVLFLDNIYSNPVSCFGGNDGGVGVQVSGGIGGKTYVWNTTPLVGGAIRNNLAAGQYTVTATDQQGCQLIDSIVVQTPAALQLALSSTAISCFQATDGTATATVLGGTLPYSYLWANGQTTAQATNLGTGDISVVVTDDNGCTIADTVFVPQATPLATIFTVTPVSCNGLSDGEVSVSVSGGVTPYSFLWSNGDITPIADGLASGMVYVTITDGNGCLSFDSTTVSQPAALSVSLTATAVNCAGGSDGSVFATAIGGTMPFSYAWNVPNTNGNSLNNLPTGTYSVTVTDGGNCSVADTITVTTPTPLVLALSQQPTTCFGVNDGAAFTNVSGGTPNYTFLWNNGNTNGNISGLAGNRNYSVTVTDANGCILADTILVQSPTAVVVQVNVTDESCFEAGDGTATTTVTGGTAPYTYTWNNGQTTDNLTGLSTGIYAVTVLDANNCFGQSSGIVNMPNPLQIQVRTTNVACFGDTTGMAIAIGSGGAGGYNFLWQTNNGTQSGDTASNLTAAQHTVTVTDRNGCNLSDTFQITQPSEALSATLSPTDITCFGDENGRIVVTAQGGTAPYTYRLNNNNFSTANTFVGLSAGNNSVRVRDAKGCQVTESTIINEPSEIIVDLGADILVEAGTPVDLSATVTNGIEPFTYVWQPADTLLSCLDCPNPTLQTPLFYKKYELFVTDADGCTGDDFIIIRTQKTRNVFIANAFTPNNDGANDALFVQGDNQVAIVKAFRVFDRWGELVFESLNAAPNNELLGWDGNYKGQPLNSGVFTWYVEVEFADKALEIYKGSTFLIR